MARRWRGVLVQEDVQTGDGRVIAAGVTTWVDPPLPLAWLQEEQHGDLLGGAVQVGTIDTISRSGNDVIGEGDLDDGQTDGAELCRRLDEGMASMGNRIGVSIDPDDWEVELIITDMEDDEGGMVMLLASAGLGAGSVLTLSGAGPFLDPAVLRRGLVDSLRSRVAAAGDPDPGPGGGDSGVTIYEDAADAMLARYTRLRIRGATCCAVPAFDGAYLELTDSASAAAPAPAVAASAAPARPPRAWFFEPEPELGDERLVEQPDGSWACPLTITDEGQVYGHVAASWNQCHVGLPGCATPSDLRSATGYAFFHTGEVETAEGERVPSGALVVGCDHAPEGVRESGARDFYANAGLGWADVRAVDGVFAPWFCGATRPGLTDADLRVLRALSPSGDWRRINGHLEMLAVLTVNTPGYPVAREALVASAMPTPAMARLAPAARYEDGVVVSLVAAGVVQPCAECAERARMDADRDDLRTSMGVVMSVLDRIDRRTRHLVADAAAFSAKRFG